MLSRHPVFIFLPRDLELFYFMHCIYIERDGLANCVAVSCRVATHDRLKGRKSRKGFSIYEASGLLTIMKNKALISHLHISELTQEC